MRCFHICTLQGVPGSGITDQGFYPVEEILTEGGLQQSIQCHLEHHGEHHEPYIKVFFPEMPTQVLTESQLLDLQCWAADEDNQGLLAREVLSLYNSVDR